MRRTDFTRGLYRDMSMRNIALDLDAPRFRHLGQAVRDSLMWLAAGIIFLTLLDVVVSSKPFIRAVLIGVGGP